MHQDLRRVETELVAALRGLDAYQTQVTPVEQADRWNIQQIVEHLILTYQATVRLLQNRLDKGSVTRAESTLRQRFGQLMVIRLGRFPYGMRAPDAVAPSLPATVRDGAMLAERASLELAVLDRVTAEGERKFGVQKAASHMVLGPMSMRQWRRFHLVHGLHHVKQILAIRRANGFS